MELFRHINIKITKNLISIIINDKIGNWYHTYFEYHDKFKYHNNLIKKDIFNTNKFLLNFIKQNKNNDHIIFTNQDKNIY